MLPARLGGIALVTAEILTSSMKREVISVSEEADLNPFQGKSRPVHHDEPLKV